MLKKSNILIILIFIFLSCSTEKEGFVSKSYHYLTTRYNGYFNANNLVNDAIDNYRNSYKEDYDKLLSLENFPNDKEVIALNAQLDTAKKKLEKVILNHSMPNASKIKKEKVEEHNNFIDESWLLVGKIKFYKNEFDSSEIVFDFLHKFFKENKTAYEADIWKSKILIKDGNYAEAKLLMDKLDKVIEFEEEKVKKTKVKKSKYSKKRKKKRKKEKVHKPDKFPNRLKDDLEITRASMFIKREDYNKAIFYLEKALKYSKNKRQTARIAFILGQLNTKLNLNSEAVKHFTIALKKSPDYELEFYARIKRAMVANGEGSGKLIKQLKKMLKDDKNLEFKDQIYYALANIELNNGNKEKGITLLHKSVIVSLNNEIQKGKSYLKLGDVFFNDKNYLKAQKYYDSCSNVIPETFPNFEGIKNKSRKLEDLVVYLEEIYLQDSLQKIAKMTKNDQTKFLKQISKKLKKDEKDRLENEAKKIAELQELQSSLSGASSGSGGKWYFYNTKLLKNGREEFKQLWGNRLLEDNWRRKYKINQAKFNDIEEESNENTINNLSDTINKFDPKFLALNIPKNQAQIDSSNTKLFKALYESGVIYKEQLGEKKMAIKQFENILKRKIKNKYTLPASYQLYKMYQIKNPTKSNFYKKYVLNNYPNSEFAYIIRDPEYIKKQLERREKVRDEYAKLIDRYESKQYGLVVAKCNIVIKKDTLNELLPKYYLLKAYALGKSPYGDDKLNLIASLNQLIEKFPSSTEAFHAQKILKNLNKENLGKENQLYEFNSKSEHYFVTILPLYANSNQAKIDLFDFNKAYFGNKKLKLQLTSFKDKENMLLVKKFKNSIEAMKYYNSIDEIGGKAKELQNFDRFVISLSNFDTFYKNKDVKEYKKFFNKEYK